MAFDPFKVYRAGVAAVPAIRYAMGVAGVIAVVAIIYALAKQDAKVAIFGFIFVLAGMYLLVLFADRLGPRKPGRGWGPGDFIVWSLAVLFVSALVLCLSAFAFGVPKALAIALGSIPSDVRVATAEKTQAPPTITPPPIAAAPPAPPTPVHETFTISDNSNNCGVNQQRSIEYCLAAGVHLTDWTGPNITSANCGSNITNVRRTPGRSNCITADVSLRGCGYDSILGIRNCRGRGWIGGTIVVSGEMRPS